MRVRNCIVLYIIVWRSSYNACIRIHVLSKTFPQLLELPVHAFTHNERVARLHLGPHVYILCAVPRAHAYKLVYEFIQFIRLYNTAHPTYVPTFSS